MPTPALRLAALALALAAPSLLACDQNDQADQADAETHGDDTHDTHGDSLCAEEQRDDEFSLGLRRSGSAVTVTFVTANPAPPAMDDNTWVVELSDLAGQPLADPSISAVTPFMPDHGHGTPIVATATATDTPGQFQLTPINLFMAGFWQVTLDIDAGGGITDQVSFGFCVE